MSARQGQGMKRVLGFAALLAMLACSGNVTDAPEVRKPSKGVFGWLVDRNGLPLRGAVVKAVPGTLGTLEKPSSARMAEADSTTTDSTGRYVLEDLAAGMYNLLGDYGQGQLVVLIKGVMVTGGDARIEVKTDTLRPPGRISGRVIIPGGDQGGVLCYVPGTSFLALSDDSGSFTLSGLPQGTYAVSYRKDGLKTGRTEGVEVKAGANVRLADRSLPADPAYPPPAPAGLEAAYDTLTGSVTLRWRRVDVSDLDGYWIYRNQPGDPEPQRVMASLVRDTVWRETLYGKALTDPERDFIYRLKSQDYEANLSGVYSKPVTVHAAAPARVRTVFAWNLEGSLGDSASIGDSVIARVEFRNPSRRITKLSLYVDGQVAPASHREDSSRQGSDSVKVSRPTAGRRWIFAEAVDEAGYAWRDSVSIRFVADPPRADAGRDTAVSIHGEARFQGRATQAFGRIVLYKWDFQGDGIWDDSSATGTAAHAYHQEGSFLARLLARDDDGNESVASRRIAVSNLPPSVGAFSADTIVSIHDTVRYFGDGSDADGTVASFAWDFDGDGSFDTSFATAKAFTRVYAQAGVHAAVFRITDADGASTLRTRRVTVLLDAPVADAGADTTVSVKDLVRLHARGNDGHGHIVSWAWDVGGTGTFRQVASGDTVIAAPSSPAAYWIAVLRATDDDGNQDLDTLSVAVLLDAPAVDAGRDTTLAVGQALTLQGTASQRFGTIVMHYWDWQGDGKWDDSSATRRSTVFALDVGGPRKAVFGARDDDGNLSSDTVVVSGVSYVGGIVPAGAPTIYTKEKSPYILTTDLQVPPGGSLVLQPGVTVSGPFTLLIKGGSLNATGSNADSILLRCQVRFEGSDLAGSRIDYARFSGANEALRIGVESEHQQAPVKNSNQLRVSHSAFLGTGITTDGYASTASLYLYRVELVTSSVTGTYPRSEPIILRHATVVNSTLHSDSYNEGITFDSSSVSGAKLMMGCCGSNFQISASTFANSSFTSTNSGEGILVAWGSVFENTTFDIPNGRVSFRDSKATFSGKTPLMRFGNGLVVGSRFQGPGSGVGLEFTGYQYSSLSSVRVDSSEVRGFGVGVKMTNFATMSMARNNFLSNATYDVENASAKPFPATDCYWNGAADAGAINARILDGSDNLNFGTISFTPFVTAPYPY